MDRTDTLGEPPDLDPRHRRPRHGHAPALWLALPLLAGCLWSASAEASALPCLAGGGAAATAALALDRRRALSLALVAAAGLLLGAAWHTVRSAPRSAWIGKPCYPDLFVRVERCEARTQGGWWAVGTVERGPAGTLRRRIVAEGLDPPPRRGSLGVLRGALRAADPEGPGAGWRSSLGITLRLSGSRLLGEAEPPSAWTLATERAARRLETALQESRGGGGRGERLLAATMLGKVRLLSEEDRESFAATGTLHLFAISGLHIAGMAALLASLGSAARLNRRAAAGGALLLLALYVEITGGAPSARRAWLMAAGILACRLAERRPNPAQGLALAAALTLLLDPEAATDAGFQLSYLSVAGILLAGAPAAQDAAKPTPAERLTPPDARGRLDRGLAWARARAAEGLCVSAGATLAGAATVLGLFGQISLLGILVNVLLVPMATVPLGIGMASVALTPLSWADPLRLVLNAAGARWLEGMAGVASAAAEVPGMSSEATWRAPWMAGAAATAMLGAMLANAEAQGWRRLLLRPAALALLLALAATRGT